MKKFATTCFLLCLIFFQLTCKIPYGYNEEGPSEELKGINLKSNENIREKGKSKFFESSQVLENYLEKTYKDKSFGILGRIVLSENEVIYTVFSKDLSLIKDIYLQKEYFICNLSQLSVWRFKREENHEINYKDMEFNVDGKDINTNLIVLNNKAYVPIRFLLNSPKFKMKWDNSEKVLKIKNEEGVFVNISPFKKQYSINYVEREMKDSPIVYFENIYVTFDFLVENFFKGGYLESKNKIVLITDEKELDKINDIEKNKEKFMRNFLKNYNNFLENGEIIRGFNSEGKIFYEVKAENHKNMIADFFFKGEDFYRYQLKVFQKDTLETKPKSYEDTRKMAKNLFSYYFSYNGNIFLDIYKITGFFNGKEYGVYTWESEDKNLKAVINGDLGLLCFLNKIV